MAYIWLERLTGEGWRGFGDILLSYQSLVNLLQPITNLCSKPSDEHQKPSDCMETTGGYDRGLCNYLYGKSLCVWRESTLQIRRSSGFRRGKDDKSDSLNIADSWTVPLPHYITSHTWNHIAEDLVASLGTFCLSLICVRPSCRDCSEWMSWVILTWGFLLPSPR